MGLYFMQDPKPKIPEGKQAGENAVAAADADAEDGAEEDGADTADGESENTDTPEEGEEAAEAGEGTSEGQEAEKDTEEIKAATPEQFPMLGSLDPADNTRFLVTFSTRGGAIKQIESNIRKKRKSRLRYRDLEYKGGYLGELNLMDSIVGQTETELGKTSLKVRSVGKGTPAAIGGVQVDDEILSFKGPDDPVEVPVITKEQFQEQLSEKYKESNLIQLTVWRDGVEKQLDVTLGRKPISITRPEPDTFDLGLRSPESFLLTLRKPSDALNWPELDPDMTNAQWDFAETVVEGQPGIEFTYTISAAKLKKHLVRGPIKVTRTYWLPEIAEDDRYNLKARDSHVKTRIKIENLAGESLDVAYELRGPTGTPTEGWWYVNKIHGRSSAVGYMAGTRDVAGSSEYKNYKFFGGPEIIKNAESTSPSFQEVFHPTIEASQKIKYVGVDTQYFNVSLLPAESEANSEWPYACHTAFAGPVGGKVPSEDRKLKRLADCTFFLFDRVQIGEEDAYTQEFDIFAGPKEPNLLAAYGLENNRTFGWFALFSKPLCWLLKVFYTITGSWSYGLAIIMLTVLVRSLMIPISRKAALNAQMMQALQPQMKAIADRYKDDMEGRASAQRELFKRNKYNPFGGCLLMFFQLPIFIGLYRGLSVDIALRDQPLIPGLNWCTNLAAPDQLFYWKDFMPSFLASETGFLGPYFNLLPMFTIVLFLMQQKLFTPPAVDDQQKMMQKMMTFMMFFMGILFFKVPAALCLYFITSSLWGIIERKMLPKPKLSDEKIAEIGGGLDAGTIVEGSVVDENENGKTKKEGGSWLDRMKEAIEENATGKKKKQTFETSAEEKKQIDRDRRKRLKKKGK